MDVWKSSRLRATKDFYTWLQYSCLNQHWHSCLSIPSSECISAFIYKILGLLDNSGCAMALMLLSHSMLCCIQNIPRLTVSGGVLGKTCFGVLGILLLWSSSGLGCRSFLLQMYFVTPLVLACVYCTWLQHWYFPHSLTRSEIETKPICQGAVQSTLFAVWMQGPPAVSALATRSVCLGQATGTNFIASKSFLAP